MLEPHTHMGGKLEKEKGEEGKWLERQERETLQHDIPVDFQNWTFPTC